MSGLPILVIGNAIVDHVFWTPDMPVTDGKSNATDYRPFAGGQAANCAATLAKLGRRVIFVGAFGTDYGAELCLSHLAGCGVDITQAKRVDGTPQTVASVVVSGSSRSIVMHKPTNLALDNKPVSVDIIRQCAAIYSDGYEFAATAWVAFEARKLGIPVVADLEVVDHGQREMANIVDHLIVGADILMALADARDPSDALRRVSEYGPSVVVSTMGEFGAHGLEAASNKVVEVAARCCNVVDTTGAGDAFRAGYVDSLLKGYGLEARLAYAAAVGAAKCETLGPCADLEKIKHQIARLQRRPQC